MHYCTTRQLHYNAVVMVHGKKRVITDRVIYMGSLFTIFNATSFPGFYKPYTPVYQT